MNTEQKKEITVVVGLGITGLSVVNYLVKKGQHVVVTDNRTNPPNQHELPEGIETYFGELNEEIMLQANEIIVSPGLSLEIPAIVKCKNKGIPIVGDVHLLGKALRSMSNPTPVIAITGSNAKSTVTTLVANMAETAGIHVAVGGNLGRPALDLLNDDADLIVLEVSSFQLESTTELSAKVATILNMSPDHLDRHHDMAGYHLAKQRIFQGAEKVVINRDDDLTVPKLSIDEFADSRSFGVTAPESDNFGLITEQNKTWIAQGSNKLISSDELKVKGIHNLLNVQSALALGELAGIPMAAMLETLRGFKGLAHRCEFVDNVQGIDFFNDSKGTNVGSTLAAINGLGESYQSRLIGNQDNRKLIVILGGEGKGQDFTPLTPALEQYVKTTLMIGRDAEVIADKVPCTTEVINVQTLENAMQYAKTHAKKGDVVLLSPACASFDQFKSYVARGERFVELVHDFK